MKRKVLIPSMVVLSIVIIGLLSISVVGAADTKNTTLVQKIAQHFNLQESEVQKVFSEFSDEKKAEAYANWVQKLEDLVSQGKLTNDQKNSIVNKHNEIQDKISNIKQLSKAEKKAEIKKIFDDLKQWSQQNGIEKSFFWHWGYKRGFRAGMIMGN